MKEEGETRTRRKKRGTERGNKKNLRGRGWKEKRNRRRAARRGKGKKKKKNYLILMKGIKRRQLRSYRQPS